MNTPRFRRPLLALACACAVALCLLAFGPQRPIAEARRSAPPSPSPAASAAFSPDPSAQPSPQASDPGTPSPADATSPAPSSSPIVPFGRKHKHDRPAAAGSPTPAPTPTSPAFSSLDGYWEVVLQTNSDNFYSRFDLHQSADSLTGIWTRNGKKLPIEGTYSGRQFKFTAKDDTQKSITLTGYVENASDMVGLVDDGSGKPPVAFTASHRAAFHTNFLPKRGEKRGTSVQ